MPALWLARLAEGLSPSEAEVDPRYNWTLHARPSQLLPEGDWFAWVVLAGRGWGKTRVSMETARHWVKRYPMVNMVGATADDARDIMIQGESGILAICPKDERPRYIKSERKLAWPNGATSLIFTADEPDRLRGKQHMKLLCDEVAAWRYPEAWEQAILGLRLGDAPQAVVTTTPRPTEIIKRLVADPRNIITRGSTYENRDNLAPDFFRHVVDRYQGTRLGRQELNAEILEDIEGALWHHEWIDKARVAEAPAKLARVVVAIDPAGTHNPDSDQTGMCVVGKGNDGMFYVLHCAGYRLSPQGWASRALDLYDQYGADRLIAERNNGGEMVESTIRNVRRNAPIKTIVASRGKALRAEPVAALYEQGKCRHVGIHKEAEEQMCSFPVANENDDMVDALVYAITELDAGVQPFGWMKDPRGETRR